MGDGVWNIFIPAASRRAVMGYRCLYILAIFIGPFMTVEAVWTIADIFNALMALPNLIALLALSGVVLHETKEYWKRMGENVKTAVLCDDNGVR